MYVGPCVSMRGNKYYIEGKDFPDSETARQIHTEILVQKFDFGLP